MKEPTSSICVYTDFVSLRALGMQVVHLTVIQLIIAAVNFYPIKFITTLERFI